MCKRFLVVGISDVASPEFHDELTARIAEAPIASGGKRHHAIVEGYLRPDARWIDITVPLSDVFAQYRGTEEEIVVFASGDPLFYGLATTLRREFPEAEIEVIPTFNSLQMLAHKLLVSYGDMRCVSLTGRPWDEFDATIIEQPRLIGVLTDRRNTPAAIASRMIEYGYENYEMAVGEKLGNEAGKAAWYQLEDVVERSFEMPCSVMLRRVYKRMIPFGIPDTDLSCIPGRPGMMTKMPIRLISLAMLGLEQRDVLWDIGFCTGSISIEAKLRFPSLKVTAFEQRPESLELMRENARRFGAPGITPVIGDFFQQDLGNYPAPDAVFIGGHGGRLPEMMAILCERMVAGGCIVFNSVSESSRETFIQAAGEQGLRITASHTIALDSFNPVTILRAEP